MLAMQPLLRCLTEIVIHWHRLVDFARPPTAPRCTTCAAPARNGRRNIGDAPLTIAATRMSEATSGTAPTPPRISLRSSGLQDYCLCAARGGPSLCKRQGDFAREPLVAPIKMHLTPELANHVFHYACAEPAMRGRRDGRPA